MVVAWRVVDAERRTRHLWEIFGGVFVWEARATNLGGCASSSINLLPWTTQSIEVNGGKTHLGNITRQSRFESQDGSQLERALACLVISQWAHSLKVESLQGKTF